MFRLIYRAIFRLVFGVFWFACKLLVLDTTLNLLEVLAVYEP